MDNEKLSASGIFLHFQDTAPYYAAQKSPGVKNLRFQHYEIPTFLLKFAIIHRTSPLGISGLIKAQTYNHINLFSFNLTP